MNGFSRIRQSQAAYAARRTIEPRPDGRSSRAVAGKPHRDTALGRWVVPLPTIDPMIVARSGAALPSYGPEFRYSHYAGTKTLRSRVSLARHALRSRCRVARTDSIECVSPRQLRSVGGRKPIAQHRSAR